MGCSAREANGHATAAPPTSVMNVRLCICFPLRRGSLALCDRTASGKSVGGLVPNNALTPLGHCRSRRRFGQCTLLFQQQRSDRPLCPLHSPFFAGFDRYSCDCVSLFSGVTLSGSIRII